MTSHRGDSSVRVAVDVAAVRKQATGVGTYVRRLVEALHEVDPHRFPLIGLRPDSALHGNGSTSSVFRSRHYHTWLQSRADADARGADADLVHYTNAAAPLRRSMPYVLTVHDLSVLRHPRYHPPLRIATLPVMLAAIRGASALIVPSASARDELRAVLRVSARRITVIPHGRASKPSTAPPIDPQPVLDRLRVQAGAFVLSTGTIEPRKNHVRLIEAFGLLARDHPGLRLVLNGGPGWSGRAVLREVDRSPFRDRIVLTGYLPDEEVTALMSTCAVFAYVSLYEGFGLPIVEAMAAGAPVVTSRSTSMPEAAGDAALLVDPLTPAAIARGIASALSAPERLSERGRAWANGRPWSDVAREVITVYDEALNAA